MLINIIDLQYDYLSISLVQQNPIYFTLCSSTRKNQKTLTAATT